MPEFFYQARRSGELVTGTQQATNARALAAELSAAGLLPVKIQAGAANESAKTRTQGFFKRVGLNEIILCSHQMHSLSRAGVSVVAATLTQAESNRNEVLKRALLVVADDLEGGLDLASGLRRHAGVFSELYVSLIHVGENTGRLDEAFKQAAGYLELERETRRRINAATRYPCFVLLAMAVAVVILNIFVIPAFATVFAKYGADLPWQTRVIVGVSDFFVLAWPYLLLLTAGAVGFGMQLLRTPAGRCQWHRFKLRIPLLGSIFERIYLGRFCHSFAMVNRAGVPLVQGLTITARAIGNDYMAQKIDSMRENIEKGESIATTARSVGLFSPVVLQMMSVGEETGSMDDLLDQAAEFYEEEVEYELKRLTDALEPILIIAIAILVLIMALGVFLPLWDLNSVAR